MTGEGFPVLPVTGVNRVQQNKLTVSFVLPGCMGEIYDTE